MSDNLPPDLERLIEEGVADQSIFTPANRDAPEGATEAQEREQRYAEAIHGNRTGLPAMCEVASDEDDEVSCWVLADAAIRVADAEQAELRTELAGYIKANQSLARRYDLASDKAADARAERDRARDLAARLEAECARLSETLAQERAKVAALWSRRACPTCEGRTRETTGLVCLACGWDYGKWGAKPGSCLTGPTETGD